MTVDRTKELNSLDMEDMLPTYGRFIQLFKPLKEPENNKNKFNNTTDNLKLIQVLDATTEDPFTIESFDTLIQQHAEQGKNFILARVITSDPLDNTKMYQSHYSAHHINKVLFRTQPEQGLLHRMKAKNANVHYYVVKAETVKLEQPIIKPSSKSTISHVTTLNLTETVDISATSALDLSHEVIILSEKIRWSTEKMNPKIKESEIINLQNDNEIRLNIDDEEISNISSTINHTTSTLQPSSSSQKSNEIESSIFYYKAIYYGTDDDFLMKTRVRQYFKANALDPSDSQLFAINSSTQNLGETRATGTFVATRRHLNRLIPENGFLIDRIGDYNPNQSPQASQSTYNGWRSFHNIHGSWHSF
ncbi:9240_t:CDS:2 [Diversispora eburnea]|uniref:9240_t:CDS:1 n=1 Tax=Diversispora eburnea TaxID=1213867 RepID=A0A9N9A245_9GLOM|nr:9240_t:CDS:2 [Diversispora eburnea]